MITVYGLLGSPSVELRIAAASADVVVGGRRHLDLLDVEEERRIVLGALAPAIEKIVALPSQLDVVVIASGDPLYFGVVRALRVEGLLPIVVPAISSIAAAFAAVGLPWDDAVVVSAHGRPITTALNVARAFPKVAVLTSAANGVRELAAGLAGLGRWFVLAENLGERGESVRVLDTDGALRVEPSEPNVVLVLATPPEQLEPAWTGTIAAPVRPLRPAASAAAAVAFARLLPEPGELLSASGPLADDVSALAAWAGAAVHRGVAEDADVVLTDAQCLPECRKPRAVVFTGAVSDPLPAGYRWATELVGDQTLTTGTPE